MQVSIAVLQKQAVDAALKNNWEKAIKLNSQIVEKFPKDLNAKIRLGRAYIQTERFSEGEKIFKEVLKADPINKIALKNLDIAKKREPERTNGNNLSAKHLIKEPGTTTELRFSSQGSEIDIENISPGDKLTLKIKKASCDVYLNKKLLGTITDRNTVKDLNIAKSKKVKFEASFIKKKGIEITALIKASSPVFKSEKQDIKPYFKKGTIEGEESELEIANSEVEE